MKMIHHETRTERLAAKSGLTRVCLASCRQLLQQITKTKNAIGREFRQAFQANDRLLRLALNEAEALAWQTDYPHLLFPVLAHEKFQSAARWETKQQSLRDLTATRQPTFQNNPRAERVAQAAA